MVLEHQRTNTAHVWLVVRKDAVPACLKDNRILVSSQSQVLNSNICRSYFSTLGGKRRIAVKVEKKSTPSERMSSHTKYDAIL